MTPPTQDRLYKCDKCTKLFKAKPGPSLKCPCGSLNFRRAAIASESPGTGTGTVPPPPVSTIPTPPPAPPVPKGSVTPPKGPVKSLAEQLKASKVGVLDPQTGARTINRDTLDNNAYQYAMSLGRGALPPTAQGGTVAELLRFVANDCQVTKIGGVSLSFLLKVPFLDRNNLTRLHFASPVVLDLTLPLAELAKGVCRPYEHANANSEFRNRDGDLPRFVEGERVQYVEFGWRFPVPPTLRGVHNGKNFIKLAGGDMGLQKFAATRVLEDGGTVDAGLRLVISDWGYLFLTTDHYDSFLIYDSYHRLWKHYTSRQKTADASWFNRGEQNAHWKVPVDGPRFW